MNLLAALTALGLSGDEWLRLFAAAGLSGLLLEGFRTIRDRRQSDANVADTITRAATVLLDPLTKANVTITKERDEAIVALDASKGRERALTALLDRCRDDLAVSRREKT